MCWRKLNHRPHFQFPVRTLPDGHLTVCLEAWITVVKRKANVTWKISVGRPDDFSARNVNLIHRMATEWHNRVSRDRHHFPVDLQVELVTQHRTSIVYPDDWVSGIGRQVSYPRSAEEELHQGWVKLQSHVVGGGYQPHGTPAGAVPVQTW